MDPNDAKRETLEESETEQTTELDEAQLDEVAGGALPRRGAVDDM